MAGRQVVNVKLTLAANSHGLALALPERLRLDLARPAGLEPTTFRSAT